jgi:quinol monooxygenase YgiN
MTRLLLAGAVVFLALLAPLSAQEPGQQLYVVTHVDLAGPTAAPAGTKLLQEFVADTRKDAGLVRIELLQEPSRLNHLTIVEVWKSRQDFESHLTLAHSKSFRDKLQPLLGSPFDERLHVLLP